ncbi:HAMP domain-containing sensor histidine kinase [Kiloniella laminariae]|uniref:histidine kinase n=1 Tax=Kiloniella laminariae TaxID=454162 RepID=A0ABT4LPI0_9PROT|nr:HAMP domain-containing sensor histidine kinase [Kiloniella laminariae]MCZ4282989.1 HAMP domain-containing sensor histidine kinase [Kiloniella laminariae]
MSNAPLKKTKAFWNVGRKIFVVSVSIVLVLFAVFTSVNWYMEKQRITKIWIENVTVKTERLAAQISGAVRREQPNAIWHSFNFLTPSEQVTPFDLRVYNPSGKKLLEHVGLNHKAEDLRFSELLEGKTQKTLHHLDDKGITIAVPIKTLRSKAYGTLIITWSLSPLNTHLLDSLKSQGFLSLGILALASLIIFFLVRLTIGSHLTQLSNDMLLIVNNQRPQTSKLFKRQDEFGVLALSLEVFKRRMDEFRETRTKLEEKTNLLGMALEKEVVQNSMQRDFVSMASHEIRTPLTIIDSSVQRIRRRLDTLDKDFIDGKLHKISGATQRMLELLDSTLSASRIEAGEVEMSLTPVDLAGLLALTCINHQDYSEHHQIIYDVQKLPRSILVDKPKITQVFSNLLSNAIKYSPGASKVIVGGYIENGRAYITFQDFGIGIAREDWPHIFDRYFRSSNTAGISGTGIGLCLVQWLLELHGGAITIESELEQGSVFTVMLPIKDSGDDQAEIINIPLTSTESDLSKL